MAVVVKVVSAAVARLSRTSPAGVPSNRLPMEVSPEAVIDSSTQAEPTGAETRHPVSPDEVVASTPAIVLVSSDGVSPA